MPATDGGAAELGWLDWQPLREGLLDDIAGGLSTGRCSARFHAALAEAVVEVAHTAALRFGIRQVALAGGCFQNRLLLETTLAALRRHQLEPFHSEQAPINDGGLAVGQILADWLGMPNP